MNYSSQKIGGKTILCDITSFPHNNCFLTKVSLSRSQLLIWIGIRRPGRCGSVEEPPQRLPWTFSYLHSWENTSLLWDNLGLFLNSLAGHGLLLALWPHDADPPTKLPTPRASKAEMAFLLAGRWAETLSFKEELLVISWELRQYVKSSKESWRCKSW